MDKIQKDLVIMTKYISKSAVAAELEKRIKKYATINVGGSKELDALYGAKCKALMEILSFLDAIEVKEGTEWNEASIKPPFVRTEGGNKYSEPLLCRDKFGNYFIANYVRWRTGYYGWFSGDDEISITHWKELQ